MNTRRSILLATFVAVASGCASPLTNEFDYEERFDSLSISAAGDVLLVLGAEFDYLFRPPQPLIAALHSDLRRALSASFSKFELDSPKDIKGEWHLVYVAKDSDEKGISLARALGFTPDGPGRYILTGAIEGTRYLKNGVKQISTIEKTNRLYSIRVTRSRAFTQRAQIESSPVSHSGNGALVVGVILLMPLILLLNPCITCK